MKGIELINRVDLPGQVVVCDAEGSFRVTVRDLNEESNDFSLSL